MKFSISNIAWDDSQDEIVYKYLNQVGFDAVEIAPTRLIKEAPYDNISLAVEKVKHLKENYSLKVSSMQSIWYGRTERIFGSQEERNILIEYTKKAVEYAAAIECKNLVFGSPKNRIIDSQDQMDIALDFFYQIAKNAKKYGIVIALEPNPEIYNTNFINNTIDALQFVKKVNSKGLKVNMDLGTVIWNNENIDELIDNLELIHHIHISEPYLERIEARDLHKELNELLISKNYNRYISIEMKNFNDLDIVKRTIDYVNEVMR